MPFPDLKTVDTHYHATLDHRYMIRRYLLEGGDPNKIGKYDQTALTAAVVNLNTEIAAMLLDAGANINAQDRSGYTALHYAMQSGGKRMVEMATFLLLKGAKIDIVNNNGFTALQLAEQNGYYYP